MTDEDWKHMQEDRRRCENMGMASKRVGNALRYLAFCRYSTHGISAALEKVKSLTCNQVVIEKISAENAQNIENGLVGELRFFDAFHERFHLVPTLDAGCSFDFIGKVDDEDELRCLFGGRFIRIDVTTSLEEKKKKEVVSCLGQKQWPYVFAHIKDSKLNFCDEQFNSIGDGLKLQGLSGKPNKGIGGKPDVRYQCVRREVLEYIQTHENATIDACKSSTDDLGKLPKDQQENLNAQMMFFLQYRYALNIVPALEMGEFTDFIGEHDGELVRYLIITSIKDYYAKIRPSIEKLSKRSEGRRYKIALFDEGTKMFRFFDWDHWYLLDDMPDWNLVKGKGGSCE